MSTVDLRNGDCLDILKTLPGNSVDAVVTDPPYGLSNTNPSQVADALTAWVTGDDTAVPAKRGGFMGKDWDSFVPPPAVWKECLRVLKPGGHMAVFAGARTQDLMGLSIRLAGFEIRDTLGWVYGSGFPKSHDIGKAIDKRRDERHEEALQVTRRIAERAKELGISRRDINLKINGADNSGGSAQSWTTISSSGAHKPRVPEWDQWVRLRELLNISDPVLDDEVWRLNGRKGTPGEAWGKREVVGSREVPQGHAFAGSTYGGDSSNKSVNVTSSHSDAARQWEGWGTALKPAIEPIILARKPLDGTVAANVLEYGTGGLNIDACRVGTEGGTAKGNPPKESSNGIYGNGINGACDIVPLDKGRFPANVLLDEHAAKEMDKQSGVSVSRANTSSDERKQIVATAAMNPGVGRRDPSNSHTDSGGASRFFPVFKYQAKAPKRERPVIERADGTKIQHPTVKPLELMKWLVRLTCPPGGTVLEPFAGSGTTVQAARDEGFDVIGIEQDPEYIELIRHRLDSNPAPEAPDDDPVLF